MAAKTAEITNVYVARGGSHRQYVWVYATIDGVNYNLEKFYGGGGGCQTTLYRTVQVRSHRGERKVPQGKHHDRIDALMRALPEFNATREG
jgi:hypothetical protein